MTDSAYILDLADKAARCALRTYSAWTPEDWQDARQEAAAAIWRELRPGIGEGYLFCVAKSAIYDWLRAWLRHPRGGTILDYLDYPAETTDGANLDARIDALFPLLARARGKRHGFATRHIQAEIAYLKLRVSGLSTAGIAQEMGLSERNIYAIRERLLPRLEWIRQERGVG